jgi:FKBP-type peptidyl-prolyl cis-trans isomerase 2
MFKSLSTLLSFSLLTLLLATPHPLLAAPSATVATGKKVSLEYSLLLGEQETITTNAGHEPLVYEHGKHEIIPTLEQALEGLQVGDRKQITLKPEEAYGPVIQEAIVEVEAERLPQESRTVGALVQLNMPDGNILDGQITAINHSKATVDFNHPLAGKTLHFDITVVAIQ